MGRGTGRYTRTMFGPPPILFSLFMFHWLKPKYVVPPGPGPPPDQSKPRRVRYRSRDPFDLRLDTRETRARREIPPTEQMFMAMAHNIEDIEEDQMKRAMTISEQDVGGLDKEWMVRMAIEHLRTEKIIAQPSTVTVNSQGDCLPDCIIASRDPHVEQAHLRKLSRNLRIETVFRWREAIKKATRRQLEQLADLSTGREGAGRQTTREGILSILEKFGLEYAYRGEGGDLFTSLVAYAINRPIILVDVHLEREPRFSALHPDLIFKDPSRIKDPPFVLVRSGDHFEPLFLPEDQAANILTLYKKIRESDFKGSETPQTPETADGMDSDTELMHRRIRSHLQTVLQICIDLAAHQIPNPRPPKPKQMLLKIQKKEMTRPTLEDLAMKRTRSGKKKDPEAKK